MKPWRAVYSSAFITRVLLDFSPFSCRNSLYFLTDRLGHILGCLPFQSFFSSEDYIELAPLIFVELTELFGLFFFARQPEANHPHTWPGKEGAVTWPYSQPPAVLGSGLHRPRPVPNLAAQQPGCGWSAMHLSMI